MFDFKKIKGRYKKKKSKRNWFKIIKLFLYVYTE